MKYFFGPKNRKNYFEGWYFKHTSENLKIAFIPSISIVDAKDKIAFIQVISNSFSERFEFAYEDFFSETKSLNIKINNNYFSSKGIDLNLKNENYNIKVDLKYSYFSPLKRDIMGPFKNLPKMECKHNIFSMKHYVNGIVTINEQVFTFDNDLGYIEGDYGSSFPSKYMWIQSNNINNGAFFLSVATIPYYKINFTGLIASLIIKDKEYRFATYNFSKVLIYSKEHIKIKRGKYLLEVYIKDSDRLILSAPKNGDMTRKVHESMEAIIEIIFSKSGNEIYHDIANNASIEIGDL